MIEPNYLPFILIGGGIIFVILFFHYVPFFLWLSAKVSGVRISLIQLFLMQHPKWSRHTSSSRQ